MALYWLFLAFIAFIVFVYLKCDADFILLLLDQLFPHKKDSLKGQVVWITGASSGIGKQLALELAKIGSKLVLSSRNEQELEYVKEQCLAIGKLSHEDVLVVPLDLMEFDSHDEKVVQVIRQFQKIDILVNNGGRSQRGAWEKTSLRIDQELFALNVFGSVNLTRKVLPHMIKQKSGLVSFVGSLAGKLGVPFSGAYSGTKFALHGYCESLALEVSEHNIRTCMICPGPVRSQVRVNSFTEKPGEKYNVEQLPTENLMATDRCTALMATALAFRLPEVWISPQPALLIAYMTQYFPAVFQHLTRFIPVSLVKKIRDGRR